MKLAIRYFAAHRPISDISSEGRVNPVILHKTLHRIVFVAVAFIGVIAASLGSNAHAKGTPPTKSLAEAPTVTSINGNPLTVRVGSDFSFEVLNSQVPGFGQFFPTNTTDTADYGWFVYAGNTLYGPDFQAHPGGSAATNVGDTPISPISISPVSGRGTTSDPFQVTVVGALGNTGLQAQLTVDYVNGTNYFAKRLTIDNNGSASQTVRVFLAGDLYLADNDFGIPVAEFNSGSPGGSDCGTPPTYFILLVPLTAADHGTATTWPTIWSQVSALQLDDTVADVGCADNAAGLQWNRTVAARSSTDILAATSFGDVPEITQFTLAEVTPDSGFAGSSVPVTLSGIGFESSTTFDFGSDIDVSGLTVVDSTTATATLTISPNAMPGSRTVTALQSSGGLTASLQDGFAVLQATAPGGVMLHARAINPGPYGVNDSVTYALGITNGSASALGGLTVTARVPSQLSIGSVQCDASVSNGTLTWPIGTLGAGASANCTFNAEVAALDLACQSNCQITVNVTAQYDGGQTSTQAVVGTLVPPQPESMTVSGAPTTEPSSQPGLSADGSLVIFQSLEKDLVSGTNTNPGGADIYLHDRRNGQTTLISR
ncbi:MAG: hypothetical protein WBV61_11035, partial [Rhodanobacteraceae bacterium]